MTDTKKTKAELQTEIFHLSNISGNLAKENALLRAQVDSGGVTALKARISELEAELADCRYRMADAEEEAATHEKEVTELDERIEELEKASDPDVICGHVHDFLRSERMVPPALDAPIFLAPHSYVLGLYEAVQKACAA